MCEIPLHHHSSGMGAYDCQEQLQDGVVVDENADVGACSDLNSDIGSRKMVSTRLNGAKGAILLR